MAKDAKQIVEDEIAEVLSLESQLEKAQAQLMQLEAFKHFIALEQQVKEQSAKVWQTIEDQMIANKVLKVSGDWGYVRINERTVFDIDIDELPAKYYKKVPDTKKIGDDYKLKGVAVKGTTPRVKQYLAKKIK